MNRNEIKKIVYQYARQQVCFDTYWKTMVLSKSNDGEDLFIYSEIGFDSLDTIEFIMNIETEFKLTMPGELFDSEVTLRKIIDYINNEINNK